MPDQPPLEGLRTLVLEDEYFVAADLKRILQEVGAHPVVLSGSIDDALANLRAASFDFALLDINIRGEMAFLVADESRRRKVPFAFVSGYRGSAIPPRFAGVPNWGKPYDDRQIVVGIQALRGRTPTM